jgi:hypothetical protein
VSRVFDTRSQRLSPKERGELLALERELRKDRAYADYPGLGREVARAGFVDETVYLRFGDLPETRRSWRGGTPYWEKGISVFAGNLTHDGNYVLRISTTGLHWGVIACCSVEDRPAYFVRGKQLRGNRSSRGACGEPLLKRIHSTRPVPQDAVIAADVDSFALEDWGRRRGSAPGKPCIPAGGLIQNDPEAYERWRGLMEEEGRSV